MNAVSPENETDNLRSSSNGTSNQSASAENQSASAENGQPVHQFQPGMGSHPLWQMYVEEMEALRQADIAEGNRLADLELGL